MKQKRIATIAWTLCAFCILGAVIQRIFWATQLTARPSLFEAVNEFGWGLTLPVTFSVLAALIIARQPGNRVGWLMMLIALATANPIQTILANLPTPPAALTPGLWLMLWLNSWSWIPGIFPLFLIPLHFPSGRPLTPRWDWVNGLAIGMGLFFILFTLFIPTLGPLSGEWTFPNPIGFISSEVMEGPFLLVWGLGLITVVSASVASLFVRYRRAPAGERQQIKSLLYAGALFAVYYTWTFFLSDTSLSSGWGNLLFVLSILTIPAAIAIAILRYRLYDIDIVIRLTLQYSLLSGLLALVYFGLIVVLQGLFATVSGSFGFAQDSPLVTVLSTLAIAALFLPLRRRVQDFIDKRFYRRKYDAAKVIADFAATARDETDLDKLTARLVEVVDETMQPESVGLWLKDASRNAKPSRHGEAKE